jgi:hypothetical protein
MLSLTTGWSQLNRRGQRAGSSGALKRSPSVRSKTTSAASMRCPVVQSLWESTGGLTIRFWRPTR